MSYSNISLAFPSFLKREIQIGKHNCKLPKYLEYTSTNPLHQKRLSLENCWWRYTSKDVICFMCAVFKSVFLYNFLIIRHQQLGSRHVPSADLLPCSVPYPARFLVLASASKMSKGYLYSITLQSTTDRRSWDCYFLVLWMWMCAGITFSPLVRDISVLRFHAAIKSL